MNTEHGTFCWNELMTRDVERAQEVLRRHHRMELPVDGDAAGYLLAGDAGWQAGRRHLPAELAANSTACRKAGCSYLAVDDVDKRTAKATAAGAKLMRPIFDVPTVGRIAILTEPGGAGVGWMTPV